ncbi:hypothetical protein BH23BAC2_BH23BAC2_03080 [soil metagenome]
MLNSVLKAKIVIFCVVGWKKWNTPEQNQGFSVVSCQLSVEKSETCPNGIKGFRLSVEKVESQGLGCVNYVNEVNPNHPASGRPVDIF